MFELSNAELLYKPPVDVELYAHQKDGYRFALDKLLAQPVTHDQNVYGRGAALLMEMGCGKTLTAIAVMGALIRLRGVRRIMIVCPLSVVGVWESELKHAVLPEKMNLDVRNATGGVKRRNAAFSGHNENGDPIVTIVNYEAVWLSSASKAEQEHSGHYSEKCASAVSLWEPELIILDEGHKIKSHNSKVSRFMGVISNHAKYRLLLTGTAITNNPMDIFGEYRFVDKAVFGNNFFQFRSRYFDMTGYQNHVAVLRKSKAPELTERIMSRAYRVTKAECLDLPEKSEEVRECLMSPEASVIYNRMMRDSCVALGKSELTATNVLTKMLRLSQITGGFLYDDDGQKKELPGGKRDAARDIIETAQTSNEKVVIIARFTDEIEMLRSMCEDMGVKYATVAGDVKERAEEVERFQNDPECLVFIGQIQAAGVGITLTAASTMVFYSMDYNMANFEQCKDRIHRIGQKHNCHYIYLVGKKTVDLKVLNCLREKRDLARALIDDARAGRNPFDDGNGGWEA